MRRSKFVRTSLDWSLYLLLVPATFASVEYLAVGLGFGFSALWRADRPFAILVWLAVVIFPGFIVWAVNKSIRAKRLRMTALLALAAWAFAAFWLWENFAWAPWVHGGPWGW